MKRRITAAMMLMPGIVLLSMISFGSANAQPGGRKVVADTGMLTLGPNEVVRLSVVAKDGASNISLRVRLTEYTAEMCNGPVCKHVVVSQTTSQPVTLDPEEAASFRTTVTGEEVRYVRAVVLSSNPNVKVMGIVFDTSTQRINGICTFIPD